MKPHANETSLVNSLRHARTVPPALWLETLFSVSGPDPEKAVVGPAYDQAIDRQPGRYERHYRAIAHHVDPEIVLKQ
ncbi:MAG: hypothetical protein CMJ82_03650 [Planctomycetaceae bacterium]|nr:hypothetical protein [Planctomycetaceae bacterium]